MRPWGLILGGFLLSVSGVALPLLMVIQVVPSTFFLNFFSFAASLLGLVLGVLGVSYLVRENRK